MDAADRRAGMAGASAASSVVSDSHHEGSAHRARACVRCSRSKLRCMRNTDPAQGPCLRCSRLGAECTLPEAKPRGPRRGHARRVGQLEQKLDGIMSLLSASKHLLQEPPKPRSTASASPVLDPPRPGFPAAGPANGAAQSSGAAPYFLSRQDFMAAGPTPETPSQHHTSETSPNPPSTQPTPAGDGDDQHQPQSFHIFPGLELSLDQARSAFDSYRKLCSPYFPFLPLRKHASPGELFAKTPLLFRTIMLLCAPQSTGLQKAADRWFRSQIAERVVVKGERTLELLLSILIFVGWFDYRFYIQPRGTPLMQLAFGLVIDLGLAKPAVVVNEGDDAAVKEAFKRMPRLTRTSARSCEEIRAILGCYYLSTLATTLLRRPDNVPHSDFIENCCVELLKADEYPSDKTLVAMVRMESFVRRAHAMLPGGCFDPVRVVFGTPVAIGLAAIRRELDDLVANLSPSDTRTNQFLQMHYYACLTAIHEPVIYTRSSSGAGMALESGVRAYSPSAARTDTLWRCLRAAAECTATYLESSPDQVGLQPLVPSSHLTFCIVTTTRLLFLNDPEWDAKEARRAFDYCAVMQRLADLHGAGEAFESEYIAKTGALPYRRRLMEDDCTPLLTAFESKIRWLRQWYLVRTAPPGNNLAMPEDPMNHIQQPDVPLSPAPEDEESEQDRRQRPVQTDQQQQQPQQQQQHQLQQPQQQPLGEMTPGFGATATQYLDPMMFDISYFDSLDDTVLQSLLMETDTAALGPSFLGQPS